MKYEDVYSFIGAQEAMYKLPIAVTENWDWNMAEHINKAILYKNSVFKTGLYDDKPFKNIVRPILNVQYRAEGFDVKDIILYVEDAIKTHKSLFVRKFHDKWARENKLDTFIDKLVETYVDFGGVLIKKTKRAIPEVVPWERIAFADQTNILSGVICEKHSYSPEELREAGKNWNDVEYAIVLAENSKIVDKYGARQVPTPGKYIEVYEVHGMFPRYWLYDYDDKGKFVGDHYDPESDAMEQVRQVHICTFYTNDKNEKRGLTLFKGPESKLPYKLLLRDEIYNRALGLGGVEELEEAQVWTNYGQIRLKELLDQASKVLYKTTDPAFANRNKTFNMQQGEILVLEDGKDIAQIDTTPRSTQLFDNFIANWQIQAREMGGATEAIFGEQPPAGTPFKSLELQVAESHSLHEYRKGKVAIFLDEVYMDWIMPFIVREISDSSTFLAELDADELMEVSTNLVIIETNKMLFEEIVNGREIIPEATEQHKQMVRDEFARGGSKRFLEILKGEFKDAPMGVRVNIVGKQKNLAGEVDKLVNVYRTLVAQGANPAILAKVLTKILEFSGLNPADFAGAFSQQAPPTPVSATGPLQKLPQRPTVTQRVAQ